MPATPRRGENCERALIGSEWSSTTIARAAQSLAKDFQPITDMRASHEYRQRVARNLLTRFHADLAQGRSTSVWSYAG
jgi:xanthine dehydrogenase small subunit